MTIIQKKNKMVKMHTLIVMCIIGINSVIDASVIGRELISEHLSIITKKMISILSLCYSDQLNTTVVFSDNIIFRFHMSSLLNAKSIPTISIDNNYTGETDIYHNYISKSNIFIIIPNSSNNLTSILLKIKSTRWWNNEAAFFIVGISTANANEMLKVMWKMNILSAFFLSKSQDDDVVIYTHNPFTNRASYPWQQVDDINKLNNCWNLYSHKFNEGENICENLKFEKTNFLDGYKIKAVASPKAGATTKIANKEYNVTHLLETEEFEHAIYFKNIFTKLNVTATIRYEEVGYWSNDSAIGFLKPLIEDKYDIALHSRAIRFSQNLTTTYPFRIGGAGVLTQYRNFLLPHEKIMRFYSIGVVLLTILSLFISIIVMLIYKKLGIISALLEILRIMLFTGFVQTINRQSVRIYFFGIFLLIVILNATFTSKLSAFLTQPERRYVTTINDLIELDYDVYMPEYVANKRNDWTRGEIKKLQIISGDGCYENVVNYRSSACIGPMARLLPLAIKYRLYLSYTIKNDEYLVYWSRNEWPLMQRVNIITSGLMEGGFLEYWRQQALIIPLKKLNMSEVNATVAKYRPIHSQDLKFAFYILAIGLASATISFIFEILWTIVILRIIKNKM